MLRLHSLSIQSSISNCSNKNNTSVIAELHLSLQGLQANAADESFYFCFPWIMSLIKQREVNIKE
jgi:hypothetical protein